MLDRACNSCGYCLDHLTRDVCPECGLAFDPTDPATYRSSATIGVGWILLVWLMTLVLPVLLWDLLINLQNWALCWWWDVTSIRNAWWPFRWRSHWPWAEPHHLGQVLLAAQVYVLAAWSLVATLCLRRIIVRWLVARPPSWPRG